MRHLSRVLLPFVAPLLAAVTSAQSSGDLLTNGDFEAGNFGFFTEYAFTPGTNTAAAQYNVLTNAATWNGFFAGTDHTTGSSLFMAINGAADPSTIVWADTLNVVPGADYQIDYWFKKIDIFVNGIARLELRVNGVVVGPVVTVGSTGWVPFSATWNAGSASTAVVEMRNLSTATSGNDFGLDDMSFVGPIPAEKSLSAVVDGILLQAGGQQVLDLDAGVARAGWTYWMFGTASGTAPGLDFGTVNLPLNVDAYFQLTLAKPFAGPFGGFLGVLDANGQAQATLTVPAGADPSLAGVLLHHAFLAAPVFGADFASNAVPLLLAP